MKFVYLLLLFSIIFSYANNLNPHKLSKDEITYLQYSPLNIYYNDWKPFTSYENGSIEGLSADIIKNLASNSNLKLNFIKVDSFSNALYKVNEDKFGAIISTSATKDREKYALFSKPYISFPISIATKLNTENILDLNELNGKKIAVGKNFTAYKLLERNYPNIQLIPVKNTIEALYLLSKEPLADYKKQPVI